MRSFTQSRAAPPPGASRRLSALLIGLSLLAGPGCTWSMLEARVFAGADEALAGAFPEATLERKAMYLTAEQQSRLEQNASLQRIGRFHTFYIAKKNGAVVGYALFDTHRVRTKEETVLVALNAGGSVREVRIVSFFEPQEYLAPERWLAIFGGKTSRDALQSGRDLPTISGATLTTRAVSTVVRKAVLLYDVHFAGH